MATFSYCQPCLDYKWCCLNHSISQVITIEGSSSNDSRHLAHSSAITSGLSDISDKCKRNRSPPHPHSPYTGISFVFIGIIFAIGLHSALFRDSEYFIRTYFATPAKNYTTCPLVSILRLTTSKSPFFSTLINANP